MVDQIHAKKPLEFIVEKVTVYFLPIIHKHCRVLRVAVPSPARRTPLVDAKKSLLTICWVSSFTVLSQQSTSKICQKKVALVLYRKGCYLLDQHFSAHTNFNTH